MESGFQKVKMLLLVGVGMEIRNGDRGKGKGKARLHSSDSVERILFARLESHWTRF